MARPASQRPSTLFLRQLCLLQAASHVTDGKAFVDELVTQAMRILQSNPQMGIELLTAVAEESEDLDRGRRAEAISAIVQRASEVLGYLGVMLTQTLARGEEVGSMSCLHAARAWLCAHPQPGGGSRVGPGDLHGHHPQLYTSLLVGVAGERSSETVVEAAVQVLVALYNSTASVPSDNYDTPANADAISALLTVRSRLSSMNGTTALAVAQLTAAVAERWPEGVAGLHPSAPQLADLMLDCVAQRREAMVLEAAIDYFLMINTVPLEERAEALRGSLFGSLVLRLHHHVSYPEGFSSWDTCTEADPDEFARIRDVILPDVLEEAYALMRWSYLSHAWQTVRGAERWQDAEVGMYYIGAVALNVRTRAIESATHPVWEVAQDVQATKDLLKSLFGHVCGPEGYAQGRSFVDQNSTLAASVCWLVERFAVWFGKEESAPLHAALHCVTRLLAVPRVAPAASKAFNTLCLRSASRLRDLAAFAATAKEVHQAMASLPLPEQLLLTEGLAHVVAGLASAEEAEAAAVQLTQPFVDRATAAMQSAQGGHPRVAARQAVTLNLSLIAASLKSLLPAALGKGDSGGGPAVLVLRSVEATMVALATSPAWQQDQEVMQALVDVAKQAVCSARKKSIEVLPVVLPAVGAVFAATLLPSCLDVLAEVLEIHFLRSADVVQGVMDGLQSACHVAFPLLQGPGLQERSNLASALLGLADSFAVYAPATLWISPLLPALLGLALAAVGLRETEPVGRGLSLLGRVLSAQERAADNDALTPAHLQAVNAVLAGQGKAATEALLRALCDTCPQQQMRSAAERLRTLLFHSGVCAEAPGWLRSVVLSGTLPGCEDGTLGEQTCSKLVQLVQGGTLRGVRLTSLFVDFGKIARREETADALLAYEL